MEKAQKKDLIRLIVGLGFFLLALLLPTEKLLPEYAFYLSLILYIIPYLIIGGDVLLRAVRNIASGQVFDENFLMCAATIGAFVLKNYTEAVAVMLFYQVGELFQSIAVGRSRRSIAGLMDIRPDYAEIERDGQLVKVDPETVAVGDIIVVSPGERVPLDGVVTEGSSQLDTAALTGESLPRSCAPGDAIISGSVNLSGVLKVRVTKLYGESTVSRILELVENAGDRKAKAENFITRFARWYTPAVCGIALLLAVIPPLLFSGEWAEWVERGLIFLVVSCPCALVISIPMSFFGGIGGASRHGILIKGGSYLEVLSKAETVVFDKTGTLTEGSFSVSEVHPEGVSEKELLELAACAESYSSHPIALSVISAHGSQLDKKRVSNVTEISGRGVSALVDGRLVLAGSGRLMEENSIAFTESTAAGTVVHVAVDGRYAGHIVISDEIKPDAAEAIARLRTLGVDRIIMLTGDRREAAEKTAALLGVDRCLSQLLPQDKVSAVESLLDGKSRGRSLAFVGDGINDAPVLARADVGIAMGGMGSDAAIEAADVVLMDDRPSKVAGAVKIARQTMRIVNQNIWFALGVKFAVLILAACGVASMWLAVFADVGVAFLAILNAMRCLKVKP